MSNENTQDETLDDIELEQEQNQHEEQRKEGEQFASQAANDEQAKYEAALEKASVGMGFICGAVNKKYDYITFGDTPEEQQAFMKQGAEKAAHVLKKYDTAEPPAWWLRWKEEIQAAVFFGFAIGSTIVKIKQHEKDAANDDGSDEGKKDAA